MFKNFFLALLINSSLTNFAQENESVFEIMERTDISLQEAEQKANAIFEKVGKGKGTGYKHFQRWLYERKFHVDENGDFITPIEEWNRYKSATQNNNLQNKSITSSNWTDLNLVNPNPVGSSGSPGTGRISAMAIHPAAENIIYVGTPDGGIWKTTNGGVNWTSLNDLINATWMSVYAVTIDPNNQNIVFAGLGNSGGIIKSSDAGATWSSVGTTFGNRVRKILIHPSNSNIVFAAASNGIYRSINAGVNWTRVHTVSKEDIEFKPNDLNIMYATGNDAWRSTNNGLTWIQITASQGVTNTGRTLVAVSPANPNYVYICQANGNVFGRMYKSIDAGLTFTTTVVGNPASGTNFFGYTTNAMDNGGQATYDMALDVSPNNASEVYIGGINAWKSTNEAVSFFLQTDWNYPNTLGYIHADVHGLHWINNTLYSITDGGIYKSNNAGDDWTDISAGLGIKQLYRFANSQTNANVISVGAQDNGCVTRQANGNWLNWTGGDGMECLVSPSNNLKIWGLNQNGLINRSIDGGNTNMTIQQPSPGNWVTPIVIHPTNDNILYGGWTGVYRSIDGGLSWTNLAPNIITSLITDLAISPSNPNQIYVSDNSNLFVTNDGGLTWTTHTPPIAISDICIDSNNPNKIWIVGTGVFTRVAVSTDAGATFTNITGNLPVINARSIVVDNNTPRGIYIGMNIGIFHKLETDVNWTAFSNNLPLVPINELEILNESGKIRVATFGRGIWESPLAPRTSGFTFNSLPIQFFDCSVPNNISSTLGTNAVSNFTNPITLSATAGVPSGTSISFSTNPIISGNSTIVTLNNANNLVDGAYSVTITGTADGAITQTRNITFVIEQGFVTSETLNQNFEVQFLPQDWFVEGTGTYSWLHNQQVGGFGQSLKSIFVDNFNINQQGLFADIIAPVNISNVTPANAILTFDVAYSLFGLGNQDGLQVLVSTDCGVSSTTVYNKVGADLATAPSTQNLFIPTASQWRTESVNLSSFIGNPKVNLKFRNLNQFGQALYIDNIKFGGQQLNTNYYNSDSPIIYPNPLTNTDFINVKSNDIGEIKLKLFSIDGKLIDTIISKFNTPIPIQKYNLSPGTYFYKIISDNKILTGKLVITNGR